MRKVLLFIFWLYATSLIAQNFSPFTLEYQFSGDNSEIRQTGSIHLAFPVFVSTKNQVILSPRYKFIGLSKSLPFDETRYNQYSLNMAWRHQLNKHWNAAVFSSPSISSGFGNFSLDGIIWSSGFMLAYRKNQHLTYFFGMAYSYQFSNSLLVPIGGFNWNPTSKLSIGADFPFRGNVSWSLNSKTQTGVLFSNNRFTSYIPNSPEYNYLWTAERDLSWFTNVKLIRNWWLKVDLGYCLSRDLYAYDQLTRHSLHIGSQLNGFDQEPIYKSFSEGLFLQCTFTYKINRK
jgi:hypothetical protein